MRSLSFAELPVGSQSSRAQTSYGICLGVLACINKPLIQLTPTEIKQHVGGKKDTSKAEIIEWAVSQQPNAPWLKKKLKVSKPSSTRTNTLPTPLPQSTQD
jgi:hypothetical protein